MALVSSSLSLQHIKMSHLSTFLRWDIVWGTMSIGGGEAYYIHNPESLT